MRTAPILLLLAACTGTDTGVETDTGEPIDYPSLSGTLVDALEDTPIADADVCADGGGLGDCTTTDSSGAFTIPNLPPGTRTSFLVDHVDYPGHVVPYLVRMGDEDGGVVVPILPRSFVAGLRAADGGSEPSLGEVVVRLVGGDLISSSGAADGLVGIDGGPEALYLSQEGWVDSERGTTTAGIAGFVGVTPGLATAQTRRSPDCTQPLLAWQGDNDTSFSLRVEPERVTYAVVSCAAE